MKIIIGLLLYFVFSGSFLLKKNNGGLNKRNTEEIKGISAILILLGHCTNIYDNPNIGILNVGWYVVAVFFFLSGYGVTYGYKNKKDYLSGFIKSRFIKVLVPFLIANIIYFIIKIIYNYDFSLRSFWLSLIGKNTIVNSSWYCLAVIIFYVVFWICFKFCKSDLSRFVALALSITAVTIVEALFYGTGHSYWFISNISFVFGVAFGLFDLSKIKTVVLLIVSSIGLVCSAGIIPLFNKFLGHYFYPVEAVSCNIQSAFFALIIITVIPVFQYNNKLLSFIGKISYEIYLYHGLFIIIFSKISFIYNNFILLLLSVCVSTILLSALLNKIDRKAVDEVLARLCRQNV